MREKLLWDELVRHGGKVEYEGIEIRTTLVCYRVC